MISREHAEKYAMKLRNLIDETEGSNNVLVKKAYAAYMNDAMKSLERRIQNGEFPTIAAIRKKQQTHVV